MLWLIRAIAVCEMSNLISYGLLNSMIIPAPYVAQTLKVSRWWHPPLPPPEMHEKRLVLTVPGEAAYASLLLGYTEIITVLPGQRGDAECNFSLSIFY